MYIHTERRSWCANRAFLSANSSFVRSDRYFLPKVSSSVFSASDKFGQRSNFGEDDLCEDEDESDDEGEEDNCGGGAFLAVIFCSCFAVMIAVVMVVLVVRTLESIDCFW